MTDLVLGVSIAPTLNIDHDRTLALTAERAGLDLIGIQDHPYVAGYLDAFTLIADLLARTERIHLFPDVANLPLRPAPGLARVSSSLSRLSGGRFQLGLGAGGYWDAITSMGVERLTPRQALAAQEEAITLIRRLWQPNAKVTAAGEWYAVTDLAGQAPDSAGVEIWLGSQGPRSLALTGRVADGWAAPIPSYLPYERWAESNRIIDRAAVEAGREPTAVRRLAQLVGTITTAPGSSELTGADPVRTDAKGWVEILTRLAEEDGFTGFVLWPEHADDDQICRFGEQIAPVIRELSSEGERR
ncbi:LLM class flavin-dependent oxidoreductase [Kribbella sandramycini]|uniref:Alkanesulfonate monooxygenase SsuD/methylene tetrahydromethanopterin reductase-like flavin-dependent oxidoreductase (Luciferase family) n=1 Tax=Kribbella sandramycini TaxID=60450 RepID=A0A7Y4KVC9_9ACTN|nr:LLM class flavin-dependent oxidoreductase [Kribbella sandramycini]MBB6568001.1 alkanesulfonate monooxygenase SsuD/methylene tetrahydromethanopterin reductase-like flavin-dependent oxidoreductase (luciferase family) [Kribbella sandramycini]NOL39405.1 LLM class flavin-dependent oxidoreductase [Kribbella sandramycini]